MNIFMVFMWLIAILVCIVCVGCICDEHRNSLKYRIKKLRFVSIVDGFIGECYPVWLNTNQIDLRTQGCGITGFFRLIDKSKSKEEFHGYIDGGYIKSTEGIS